VEDNKHRLLQKIAKLEALSPLATLARGYSICRLQDGSILRQAGQAQPEEEINVLLHQGELLCTVKEVREERDR
jgi:exodeoxyribonuclease VII large subunit